MTRTVWPYVRPQRAVLAGDWLIRLSDEPQRLPAALPYWDYNTDLTLTRPISIDTGVVRDQCGLADDAEFGVAALWNSSGSGMSAPAARHQVGTQTLEKELLEVRVRGTDLGGTLTLVTHLYLVDPGSTRDPAAPRRPGSVLWSDEASVRLQGDAARFPIDVVDFSKEPLPDRAGWHLQLGRDLDAAAMGSILLLVNSKNKTVAHAASNAENPRHVDRIVLSALYADITRAMVEHGLSQSEFTDDAEFPDDSLGQVLRDLCGQLFPHTPLSELRLHWENSPNLLATDIQARVGIFEEKP